VNTGPKRPRVVAETPSRLAANDGARTGAGLKIAQVNEIAHVPSTLAKGLRLLGHDVEVLPLKLVGGKRPTWAKLLLAPVRLQEIRALNEHIRAGKFQVVHLHYAYLGWAGILGRYGYYLHCHGTDVRSGLHDRVRGPLVVRALQRAGQVFYSTPDLREHIVRVRPDAVFIPNPIDTDHFRPAAQSVGRRSSDRPRVLFISALSWIKGVEKAFQIIERLQTQAPGVEIAVFDFGDRLDAYRNWPGLTVLPHAPYAEMPEIIRGFDVVVGQLHLGILSMSELEAMACGVPVVGDFRFSEVYSEPTPLIVGTGPAEWTAHILSLVGDAAARAQIGERSRQWVVSHHDYRTVAGTVDGYYERT
jgi:glycosyltransferase involved in cell wall biosynthesis